MGNVYDVYVSYFILLHCVIYGLIVQENTNYGRVTSLYTRDLNTTKAYKKLNEVRSLVECSVNCYSNTSCLTAVYRHGKICLLFDKYVEDLNSNSTQSTLIKERSKVVEVRTRRYYRAGGSWESISCPADCNSDSKCARDYSTNQISPVSGCMETDQPMRRDEVSNPSVGQESSCQCITTPYLQSVEFYLKGLEESTFDDNHSFFNVKFTKLQEDTTLRIRFRATTRIEGLYSERWGLWKIVFNGTDYCNVGSVHYIKEKMIYHHKATGIQGLCSIPAGDWTISLVTKRKDETFGDNFMVGHKTSGSRLYVDELASNSATSFSEECDNCALPPAFNIQQYVYEGPLAKIGTTTTFWSVKYTKFSEQTTLKINLDMPIGMRADVGKSTPDCLKWYFKIDDSDCQPIPLKHKISVADGGDRITADSRSTEIEGYCRGISSGEHTITLDVEGCNYNDYMPPVEYWVGWESTTSRLSLEEVLTNTNTIAGFGYDVNTLYRFPYFNIIIHRKYSPTYEENNGFLWTAPTFRKIHDTSGMRIMLSADARNRNRGGYSSCCRHYFTINNQECKNPGPIEGISSLLYIQSNLHRPIVMEGVCENIPSGDVEIKLYAGLCHDYYEAGDCVLGYSSSVNIMFSETFIERKTIEF